MIIWTNSEIEINNETLHYKEWHDKGILFLEHIFDFRFGKFFSLDNMQFPYCIVIIKILTVS